MKRRNVGLSAALCASTVCIAGSAFANDCPTDYNHDGTTDGRDLGMLLGAWNASGHMTDVSGDGVTDAVDLALLLGQFGLCTGGQAITSVSPHFVAPGSTFYIEGLNPATVTEVMLDGESIEFFAGKGLSAVVPADAKSGERSLLVMATSGLHRVLGGITVNAKLDGTSTTYVPTFSSEGPGCQGSAELGPGLVNFEGKGGPNRSCSNQGYTGISKITADIDLSGVKNANYTNAAFVMISNPTHPSMQPLGSNYCDRGTPPANPQFNCREIDLLETNGAAITQTTEHLRNTSDTDFVQRWQEAWTEDAVSPCFSPSPAPGGVDISSFDTNAPIRMVATFTEDGAKTNMVVNFSQDGQTIKVYDTQDTPMEGSGDIDSTDLTAQNAVGFWLTASYWQDYSPMGPNNSWWTNSCPWEDVCGSGPDFPGWKLSNLSVVGTGTVGD